MSSKLQYTLALVVFSLMVAGFADSSTDNKQAITGDGSRDYRGSWAQVLVILSRIKALRFPNGTLMITGTLYNVIADGSTDVRQGIQSAIIDVSRFGGGTVSIPKGEYYVDEPLKLEKNVNYHFGDDSAVRFSNPTGLATEVTFTPGTYWLRPKVSDGKAAGYHTVFTEVRQ